MRENVKNKALSASAKYVGIFIIALFLVLGYFIWKSWPSLILLSMNWQRDISAELSELLYDARENSLAAGLSLMSLSFVYGVLHSLGPGHGKFIVSTYVATHPTKVKASLMLTIVSALLQAVVAIILVSTLLFIFDFSMREVNSNANYFITVSFYSVVILGLVIVWRNLRSIWKLFVSNPKIEIKNETKNIVKNNNNIAFSINKITPLNTNKATPHIHDDACGCGHKHFVEADLINNASSLKEYIAIILSIGLRPCTGAIMVLLFSNVLDVYWLGMLSAFVMAIGTALTASTIAIMTITGKKIIQHYVNLGNTFEPKSNNHSSVQKRMLIGPSIQLVGGVLLMLMGVILLSSQPIGMSPIF